MLDSQYFHSLTIKEFRNWCCGSIEVTNSPAYFNSIRVTHRCAFMQPSRKFRTESKCCTYKSFKLTSDLISAGIGPWSPLPWITLSNIEFKQSYWSAKLLSNSKHAEGCLSHSFSRFLQFPMKFGIFPVNWLSPSRLSYTEMQFKGNKKACRLESTNVSANLNFELTGPQVKSISRMLPVFPQ